MYCPNCGRENQDGAKFCGGCGFVLQEQNSGKKPPKRIRPEDGKRRNQKNEPSTGGEKPKKPSGLIAVIIILAVILIALLAATAAVKIYTTKFSPQARWKEQYDLGEQYLLEMDYEQAIVAFTAAIEIDPEETAAYLGRAEAYIGEDIEEASDESLQSALDDYDTVLELEPDRTEAYLGEADIYVVMDDYDSARDILETGLEYNPDDDELSERLEEIEEQIEERELFNRYQAYYDKLMELQDLYGKAGLNFDDNADLYYRSGLFFAKLIDFDGDGAEELVTAVFDADILEETGYYANSYLIQVWSCVDEDDQVQEVYQQGHYKLYLGAGCYIACSDAVSYMVDGYDEYWSGDVPNESFYTYADGAFYAAKMFGSGGSDLTDTLTVDGEAVSDEEWNDAYNEWYAGITDKLIYYFWWYNGFEVTECETAEAPDELADTLDTLRSLLEIEEEETEEIEETQQLENETAFYDQLNELTETYGLFEESWTGTVLSYDDVWLETEGVMGAVISDLDADGSQEMLVAIAQECEHDDYSYYDYKVYHIMLYVYEIENGEVSQSASFVMGAYYVNEYLGTTFVESTIVSYDFFEYLFAVNLVEANGQCYILCEYQVYASAFADGSEQSFWLLEYTGTQLQYVCSFSEGGGGSSDFVYYGYMFEDGVCVSSDVYCTLDYYEDDVDPLYDDFSEAIAAFFGQYGIQTADDISRLNFSSILPEGSGAEVFTFTTEQTSSDWGTSTFVFSAVLERDDAIFSRASA